jgi:predicted RNA-binding Zn ribbon-like protein
MSKPPQAPSATPFELSGGALCLDFANTWGNHADPASDRLRGYAQLLAFARQTGLLDGESAAKLEQRSVQRPAQAAQALSQAKELRQTLFRIFSARANCKELPPEDVETLNGVLGQALSRRRLCCADDALEWTWSPADSDDFRTPLWPIVESAAALLTSDELGRVSECDASDCNWLFVDRSRSRSRRWCSMESCGNRAKVRRHYRRHRTS